LTNKAIFISRAGADADFAAVIGKTLEDAGYTVILQQWDFANRNFMERMHAALADDARVIALLSPEYLRSDHCQAEWQNAIADDPLNTKSRLILLRVGECEPVGLLSGLAYWDLVPVQDNRALLQDIVLDAVREGRREGAPSGPYWRPARSILDAEAIRPIAGFSGRENELDAIAEALANDGAIAAVCGLGGVGKSSIAREYAWRNRDRYSVVWWLNAQTEDAIIDGLLRLGTLFVRGLDQHADRRAAAQQVTSSMLRGFLKPVLLVFDNLEEERPLHAWRPRTGVRVLVTSRNAAWGADVAAIPLKTWDLSTAIGYLQRESGRADLDEAQARAIVEALGALPLAVAHSAAALRNTRMVTPQRYLQHIAERLKNAPRGAEYPQSVFATFATAIAQAENEAAGAAAVLCFAASFAPDAIPDELLRQIAEGCSAELRPVLAEGGSALDLRSAIADELRMDEALGALDRVSLLSFSEASRSYSIHRLVQLAARDTIVDPLAWQEYAVAVADAAFPAVEFEWWPQCERLLPHARAALDALPEDTAFLSAGHLVHRCAVYLLERAEYGLAESLGKRAVAIRERAYGADHPDVAMSLNELAIVYYREGRYDEAELLQKRALAIREKTLGADHPDIARNLHNLANIAYEQGRYDEAEPLQQRGLAIREKALGGDHPDVAKSLNDIANLTHEQGRYEEAISLYIRALAIIEKALGTDHPLFATALNNLATSYEWQGRLEEAESVHKRALAILEKALGTDHPLVATSLHNLAIIYYQQGRYEEAVPLYTRALTIRRRMLGPNHPDVARSLHELSLVYYRQARYDDAEQLQNLALAIRESALGPDHYEVAMSLNDLAYLHEARGRLEEAESLLRRALSIRELALRPDHPDVATSLSNLADLYLRQARYKEADPLYARALAIQERVLGPGDGLTIAVRSKLETLRLEHP
jgi:tetratricopeptide (TPR) repeat protein